MPIHKFSIFNFQFSIFKSGFTLIETVVVLGILTFAMGSALVLITNILKGNNQTRINAEVKQAGQVVLDSLESQIRNATDVGEKVPNLADDGVTLNNGSFFIACKNEPPDKSSNGWIGTSTTLVDFNSFKNLTNTDIVSGVSISGCSFVVINPSANSPGLVTIKFTVSQGVSAPTRKDFVATAPFQTTISLRNYK